jgi:hypothetical protein
MWMLQILRLVALSFVSFYALAAYTPRYLHPDSTVKNRMYFPQVCPYIIHHDHIMTIL